MTIMEHVKPASLLEFTWTDPITGVKGYVVLDTLVRGLASGGLRLRKGCTMDEVRGLAQGMSRKEMLVYDPADLYVPLGGGKGGIDVDPSDPRSIEILERFASTVKPVIRHQWTTGEDFGVQQSTIDEIFSKVGLGSSIDAVYDVVADPDAARQRLKDAGDVLVDGVELMELVGGYGVACAAHHAATQLKLEGDSITAVVQGFGSIGGAAARYLVKHGVKVIAIADSNGLMRNDNGLDVEVMLAARDSSGVVDRAKLPQKGLQLGDRDSWMDMPCDVLVPAAMSYVIKAEDVDRIQAKVVVEGANMPTLPEAEEKLIARGIPVVPDFLANVMTNAWWWWLIFGDIQPTAQSSFSKIDKVAERISNDMWRRAKQHDCSLRVAAQQLVDSNKATVIERVGITR